MALWEEDDYGVLADKSCWAMFAITAVIIGLRLFCRGYYFRTGKSGGIGLDDCITVLCLAVFLVTCILITIGSHYGLGRHVYDVPPEDLSEALRWNVIISSVLIWTFSMPKFAYIATLKRILNYGLKTTILFWGLALTSQACILATSVWWWHQCSPVEYGWDRVNVKGHCADVSVLANLGYLSSAYSAFLDIFFALYPVPFIMRLNMPLKSRVTVSIAMGLGVMACAVSIYKLVIFEQIFTILKTDPTYPVPYLDILGVAEGFILLICTSLPTLGPAYRAVRGKFTDKYGSSFTGTRNTLDRSHAASHLSSTKPDFDFKGGHKLEEQGHSTGGRSSTDDIPLVAPSNNIHKKVDILVSSENYDYHENRGRSTPSL
ncbi:hypothetical protein F4779DRAFT_598479 [Xylariaceae sp. FL0662B]|nr:hypothetical protein F4779DRAFT_598479 [Xylariaceae sp. FL0662B]